MYDQVSTVTRLYQLIESLLAFYWRRKGGSARHSEPAVQLVPHMTTPPGAYKLTSHFHSGIFLSASIPPSSNVKYPQVVSHRRVTGSPQTVHISPVWFASYLPYPATLLLPTNKPSTPVPCSPVSSHTDPPHHCTVLQGTDRPTSALMSVEARQSLNCLRYPSRFETVSRSQLSKVHTGDSTRPIDSP